MGDKKSFFLGGTDYFSDSFWYWMTSGEAVGGFLDWGSGEPSRQCCEQHDCMVIGGGPLIWNWRAISCGASQYYVCEYYE